MLVAVFLSVASGVVAYWMSSVFGARGFRQILVGMKVEMIQKHRDWDACSPVSCFWFLFHLTAFQSDVRFACFFRGYSLINSVMISFLSVSLLFIFLIFPLCLLSRCLLLRSQLS